MCHGIPDAIFENISRHIVCDFFRRFCRISHCNTAACELQHIHIIDTVSHCNSIRMVNSQKFTDTSDPGCFRIPLWDNLSNIVIVQQNPEILFCRFNHFMRTLRRYLDTDLTGSDLAAVLWYRDKVSGDHRTDRIDIPVINRITDRIFIIINILRPLQNIHGFCPLQYREDIIKHFLPHLFRKK